jgi:hypothetical protein
MPQPKGRSPENHRKKRHLNIHAGADAPVRAADERSPGSVSGHGIRGCGNTRRLPCFRKGTASEVPLRAAIDAGFSPRGMLRGNM